MSTTNTPPAPVADETHHLIRQRNFSPRTDLIYLLDMLRVSRATGTLMIDFNEGGIGSIRFREEQKLAPE